jgi:hypothetical protein
MSVRQATVLVADEWTTTLSGKFTLSGVYGTDIHISHDPYFANQLVFAFIIETAPDDPYQAIQLSVTLPGGDHRRVDLPLARFVAGESDKIRWCLKFPLLFASAILRPGSIEAKVIHEKGEILTATPSIVLREPFTGISTRISATQKS